MPRFLLLLAVVGALCWRSAIVRAEELSPPANPFRAPGAVAADELSAEPADDAGTVDQASDGIDDSGDIEADTVSVLSQPTAFCLGPLDGPPASSAEMVQFVDEISAAPACYDAPCSGSSAAHQWQLMPQGLIYAPYLAGVKQSRFRSVLNEEDNDGSIWDITLGGQVGLLRHGTRGNCRPEGWQLGIEGAALLRLDRDEDRDVTATDYRFGIPLTWGTARYQQKFAYYHLSSHLGDEFLLKNPGYPRLNYSRDVLVWGHSFYPAPRWRYYAEIGYGVNTDIAEPWELQTGIDFAPPGQTGAWGAPFAAVNGHLREEVDFGGNFVVQGGWAWRRSPVSGMFRLGVEYFNGKSDQFSFFNDSEQKVGFGVWYDY